MGHERLLYAIRSGGLVLPTDGPICFWNWSAEDALPDVPTDQCVVQNRLHQVVTYWQDRGVKVDPAPTQRFAASVIALPRFRDQAEDLIARAAALTDGPVIVTGAKTDGIEATVKALKAKTALLGQVAKSHGKCVWFDADVDLSAWQRPDMQMNSEGDYTAPGVFSAAGADPASVALAAALPDTLKGRFADLGAGWGWLSREILKRDGVKALHLVEADLTSLDCAKANVTDDRAAFHWHDATTWQSPDRLDGVIMNPPFHAGRKGDPAIGQAFIASAARLIAPNGSVWMVANRHLPYEAALATHFKTVTELPGPAKFKILHAERPSRPKR